MGLKLDALVVNAACFLDFLSMNKKTPIPKTKARFGTIGFVKSKCKSQGGFN